MAARDAKAFLSVEYVKVQHGSVVGRDERMLVSSHDPKRLTPAQWLLLVRSHWDVGTGAGGAESPDVRDAVLVAGASRPRLPHGRSARREPAR